MAAQESSGIGATPRKPDRAGQGAPRQLRASSAHGCTASRSPEAKRRLRPRGGTLAPALLRIEAADVLRTMTTRGDAARELVLNLLRLLQSAPVAMVDANDALGARALELAIDLSHPVHDGIDLALAERMGRISVAVLRDGRFLTLLGSTQHAPLALALDATLV